MAEAPPRELLDSLPVPRGVAVAHHGPVTVLALQRWRLLPLVHLAVVLVPLAFVLEWLLGQVGPTGDPALWLATAVFAAMAALTWLLVSMVTDRVQLEVGPAEVQIRAGTFPGHRLAALTHAQALALETRKVDRRWPFRDTWSLVLPAEDGRARVVLDGIATARQAEFLVAHLRGAAAERLAR